MKDFTFKYLFPLVAIFVMHAHAFAQEQPIQLFELNVKEVKFEQLVQEIEKQSNFRFFYDSKEIDSLVVTISVSQKALSELLEEVFQGTSFNFAIDQANHVFVTLRTKIYTDLPYGFYNNKSSQEKVEYFFEDFLNDDTENELTSIEHQLHKIGNKTVNLQGKAIVSGYIKDKQTGEPVLGASVYIENPRTGVITDVNGYYRLELPKGRHELIVKSMGMRNTKRQIMLYENGKLNIEMQGQVTSLKEVVIEAEKIQNINSVQMGVEKLNIKSLKQIPSAFGEPDVMQIALTLPGVSSVGEASNGFNVRGGSTDQNLILFNDATIYNPSHLFGFFSAFNSDMIKEVELYKSSIPARYGGRLSSVMDVTTREGNKKKFAGSGGIGLLTSKLTLEGPLKKDKSSFLIGGRTSYSNWVMNQIKHPSFAGSQASFSDLNMQVNYQLNEKNKIALSGYASRDEFRLKKDTVFGYTNHAASIKWSHRFNNHLQSTTTGGFSRYAYNISSTQNPVNASRLSFNIHQNNIKNDFVWFLSPKHTLEFGGSVIHYQLQPGSHQPLGDQSLLVANVLQKEQGLESALYMEDQMIITRRLSLNVGLRYSFFYFLGPKDIYQYPEGLAKDPSSIIDTVSYGSASLINADHGPEYRVAARYLLTPTTSVKMSYNTLRQYIHMLSNTTAISPTDIWKLSDSHIAPVTGDQISLGFYKNLKSNQITTSAEVYHKNLKDFLDYKNGAVLILNHTIETDAISTEGKAYGIELMVKKNSGKLNGWMSYTYSRTLLRTAAANGPEAINSGKWFPANFDKPHDFSLVGNYRFSHRFSVSTNVLYSTGRPITLPIAVFELGGAERVFYSERNQYRIPDYFRIDLSLNIEGNHRIKKLAHSSWTIGIYNLTSRRNPYSVFFKTENGKVNGYQLSILGQAIPTVTYNFKF